MQNLGGGGGGGQTKSIMVFSEAAYLSYGFQFVSATSDIHLKTCIQ